MDNEVAVVRERLLVRVALEHDELPRPLDALVELELQDAGLCAHLRTGLRVSALHGIELVVESFEALDRCGWA
jgi:hypothetical protein